MQLTSVIIDDEKDSQDNLNVLLSTFHPEVSILGVANSVETGLQLIQAKQPELLFLDIELGDGTGFDILENIEFSNYATVFVTAHNHYARLAFDFAAMAYLVKPVDERKLSTAINLAQQRIQLLNYQQQVEALKEVIDNYRKEKLPNRLAVSNSTGIHYLPLEQITYLTVKEGCTEIHQTNGKRELVSANLVEYERRFADFPTFMKIHRSFMVNLAHVRTYRPDGHVILTTGQQIQVSNRHQEELRQRLGGV